MQLQTDGTENNPILDFCIAIVARQGMNWPPEEDVLASEFVAWFGFGPFTSRDRMKELCKAKGLSLSFVPLPQDIRGFNCCYDGKREIVVTERQLVPFADCHTVLHEFRELLEYEFVELGLPTLGPKDSLEETAEIFAMTCRFEAGQNKLPEWLERVSSAEKKWARYLGIASVFVFMLAYFFGCIYIRQLEEIGSQARS